MVDFGKIELRYGCVIKFCFMIFWFRCFIGGEFILMLFCKIMIGKMFDDEGNIEGGVEEGFGVINSLNWLGYKFVWLLNLEFLSVGCVEVGVVGSVLIVWVFLFESCFIIFFVFFIRVWICCWFLFLRILWVFVILFW